MDKERQARIRKDRQGQGKIGKDKERQASIRKDRQGQKNDRQGQKNDRQGQRWIGKGNEARKRHSNAR